VGEWTQAATGAFEVAAGDLAVAMTATMSHSLAGGPFNLCATPEAVVPDESVDDGHAVVRHLRLDFRYHRGDGYEIKARTQPSAGRRCTTSSRRPVRNWRVSLHLAAD
jgi:hypothetical protein